MHTYHTCTVNLAWRERGLQERGRHLHAVLAREPEPSGAELCSLEDAIADLGHDVELLNAARLRQADEPTSVLAAGSRRRRRGQGRAA
jgi:hypothetical protein